MKLLPLFLLFSVSALAETWTLTSTKQFSFFESLQRSQGVTTDDQGHFWFSANQSLIKTSTDYSQVDNSNTNPFSDELKNLGANHIGSIDYFDGNIYAPVEDGSTYLHPVVAIYDAQSLQLKFHTELTRDWQPDGAPWLTVDGKNHFLIMGTYSHTTKINFYDLKTFKQLKQLNLSMTLESIQGAKVDGNYMYLTANVAPSGFAIYKMNFKDGSVEKVAVLDTSVTEVEGLTISHNATESIIHVLGITGHNLGRRLILLDYKKIN